MLTALEIYTNPHDLHIVIGQEKAGEKFAIGILRGPGHNFKPLITSQPYAETAEQAIEAVEETLRSLQEVMARDFASRTSFASQQLNPDGEEVDQSKVLTIELVDKIVEDLRQNKVSCTYKTPSNAD
ncbi:MAG: hypothetical protein V4690_00050 [Patescibacteria group bacterium]